MKHPNKLIKDLERKIDLLRYTSTGLLQQAEKSTDDKDILALAWAVDGMIGEIEAMVMDLPLYEDQDDSPF